VRKYLATGESLGLSQGNHRLSESSIPVWPGLLARRSALNGASSEGQRTRHGNHGAASSKIDTAKGAKVAAAGPTGYHIATTQPDVGPSGSSARCPIRSERTIDPPVRFVISHAKRGVAKAPCAIRVWQMLISHAPGLIETHQK
jgi:hypothetical protein